MDYTINIRRDMDRIGTMDIKTLRKELRLDEIESLGIGVGLLPNEDCDAGYDSVCFELKDIAQYLQRSPMITRLVNELCDKGANTNWMGSPRWFKYDPFRAIIPAYIIKGLIVKDIRGSQSERIDYVLRNSQNNLIAHIEKRKTDGPSWSHALYTHVGDKADVIISPLLGNGEIPICRIRRIKNKSLEKRLEREKLEHYKK